MSVGLPAPPPASRLPSGFFREAGRACAHYVQNGGRIREIRMEKSQLFQLPLQLTPPPHGDRRLFPVRKELEEDLERLMDYWGADHHVSTFSSLRFLFSFCREMDRQNTGWKNWAYIWIRKQQAQHRESMIQRYQGLLNHPPNHKELLLAHWEEHPGLDPAVFQTLLEEQISKNSHALSFSHRAVVIESELMGQDVIIKRYAPNPRRWKRRWEYSRARRAWAATMVMRHAGLPAIQGLGWLERYENGHLQESYFISRQLTEMETLRAWVRREFSILSPYEQVRFRHRLRNEILKLKDHGLVHVDLKLSNLLIKGKEVEDLVFYWIDLEDLRAGSYSRRRFVRNLYQLNGSLPRTIPRKDREAFAAGFKFLFRFADSPRLMRFVQRKTRKRHLDELRRLQGA